MHKRGNESWSIGCDLLCNHCNDVMPYHSLMSCLTHWLDHSPSTVRLQYPIPQPFVRPHHCRAVSDAHTPQHRQQSSLFSLSHVMFTCMPAHHSSLSLSRQSSCTLHAGFVADSSDLASVPRAPTQNQTVHVVPDIEEWQQHQAPTHCSDRIEIKTRDRDVGRVGTSERDCRRAHPNGHEEWQQHQAATRSRSRRPAGTLEELGLQNKITEGVHPHRDKHQCSR